MTSRRCASWLALPVVTGALTLALFTGGALAAPAAEPASSPVTIPAKAISADTPAVIYVDFTKLTPAKINDTIDAITSAIPNPMMSQRIGMMAHMMTGQLEQKLAAIKKAGARGMLMIPPPQPAHMPSMTDPQSMTPPPPSTPLVLIQGDSPTLAEAAALTEALKPEPGQHAPAPKVSHLTGNWFVAQDQDNPGALPKNGGDAAAAAQFQTILNGSNDAAVHVAFIVTDAVRQAMAQHEQGNPMLAAMLPLMKSAKSGHITVTLGRSPSIAEHATFADTESAAAAKKFFHNMMEKAKKNFEAKVAQMPTPTPNQAQQPGAMSGGMPAPPSQQDVEAFFNSLEPTENGNVLSLTVDKTFIQKAAKLFPAWMMIKRMEAQKAPQQLQQPPQMGQ